MPISVSPAPILSIAAPNKVNATANDKIIGINGLNMVDAAPIIANTEAMVIKLFKIDAIFTLPSSLITLVIASNATLADINATDPPIDPCIAFNPTERMPNDAPKVDNPFAKSFQLDSPIDATKDDRFSNAEQTINNPALTVNIFLGIKFIPNAMLPNAPPIPINPF